jgi:hypothetical protein
LFQGSPDGLPVLRRRQFLDLLFHEPSASERRCAGRLPNSRPSNTYSPSLGTSDTTTVNILFSTSIPAIL